MSTKKLIKALGLIIVVALLQTVRRASITEIKNEHLYILIALTAPCSHGM